MLNKIFEKIKSIFYPCLTLGASTLFFFSIGFIFGVGNKSDFILLTITVLSTLGAILQASWYGFLPRLTSSRKGNYTAYIISNSIAYCFIANLLPVIALPFLNYEYLFLSGCIYSLFFQLHQLIKNIFIYLGNIKYFYIFDCLGYGLNILLLIWFYNRINDFYTYQAFWLFSLGWFIVCCSELFLIRHHIKNYISIKPFFTCIVPTLYSRLASGGFIIKDLFTSLALNLLIPNGGLTIYSYVNRISIAIFQLFSIYKVNIWVSGLATREKSDICLKQIKNIAFISSLDYILFFVFSFILISCFLSFISLEIEIFWAVFCVCNIGILYLIQSIEQPFARFIYISKNFKTSAQADAYNFIVYIILFTFGYLLKNIYIILVGLVLAQILSCYIYIYSSKKILRRYKK